MGHGYVVFDNNAYKRMSSERLERIQAAEGEHGIIPLANVVVLQELLARVRDPDTPRRGPNRAAIRKLGRHCRSVQGDRPAVTFLSHVESQVYRFLSGRPHPSDHAWFDLLGDMVRVVSEADGDDPLEVIAEQLHEVERIVQRVESEYVERLRAAAAEAGEQNEMKRNLNYAARLASRTQKLYGEEFPPEVVIQRVMDIAKLSSIGFKLWDSVVAEVRSKGGGHAQHANTVWDEEVVSSTSMYTQIGGLSVLLVTEEARLIRAATSALAADRVSNLATYEASLGLSQWVPAPRQEKPPGPSC